MQKLIVPSLAKFSELDTEQFNSLKFSVYVMDFNWNYLFVNDHVKQNLADRGANLTGKNMWQHFGELAADPSFVLMKNEVERGAQVNFITTSPINGQRLNIVGYPLTDCYFFYASQLPKKDELLNELRAELENR